MVSLTNNLITNTVSSFTNSLFNLQNTLNQSNNDPVSALLGNNENGGIDYEKLFDSSFVDNLVLNYYYKTLQSTENQGTDPNSFDSNFSPEANSTSFSNLDLSNTSFTQVKGLSQQVYTTGKKNGSGTQTTLLDKAKDFFTQIRDHWTHRGPSLDILYPDGVPSNVDTSKINAFDFTVAGKEVKAHVPFRVLSTTDGDNSGWGTLAVEFINPDGTTSRARLIHGDIPAELIAARGTNKIFNGGTTLYYESGKDGNGNHNAYPKHTDIKTTKEVVAALLEANATGNYIAINQQPNTSGSWTA